jgi:hypothetical protein
MKIVTSHSWVAGCALRAIQHNTRDAPLAVLPRRARSARPANQGGFAVIVILILLCIMLIFVMANTATVNWLGAQVNAVDKHQIQRLALASTNQLHSAQSVTNQPLSK